MAGVPLFFSPPWCPSPSQRPPTSRLFFLPPFPKTPTSIPQRPACFSPPFFFPFFFFFSPRTFPLPKANPKGRFLSLGQIRRPIHLPLFFFFPFLFVVTAPPVSERAAEPGLPFFFFFPPFLFSSLPCSPSMTYMTNFAKRGFFPPFPPPFLHNVTLHDSLALRHPFFFFFFFTSSPLPFSKTPQQKGKVEETFVPKGGRRSLLFSPPPSFSLLPLFFSGRPHFFFLFFSPPFSPRWFLSFRRKSHERAPRHSFLFFSFFFPSFFFLFLPFIGRNKAFFFAPGSGDLPGFDEAHFLPLPFFLLFQCSCLCG